ncbi:MAG: class I SAM-dependent methyltransferase [Jatrophihabitans sp.]|uniref:class I SAM-dependent methyltransferase n=1 Tax=Jatrophihabitans sp. TaxID=1932789 RepID=UPI003F7E1F8B
MREIPGGLVDADRHSAVLSREFDATARRYDLMVGLNPGYHAHLRAGAAALAAGLPERPRLLDIGCGSGASTTALLCEVPDPAEVVGVDASDGMLDQARRKPWPAGVRFVHGRAEQVSSRADEWGLRPPYDGAFACYLFRNVPAADRDATLGAVRDVLAPGGRLVVQEYSVAGSRRAMALWTLVCWLVIIPMSLVLTRRTALYRYLWRSVLQFDTLAAFTDRLERAGFIDVRVEDVRFTTAAIWQRGILHTISARRP